MTNDELDALNALADAATNGPWSNDEQAVLGPSDVKYLGRVIGKNIVCDGVDHEPNAAFIAVSREAVPRLIAELRRLRHAASIPVDGAGSHKWDLESLRATQAENRRLREERDGFENGLRVSQAMLAQRRDDVQKRDAEIARLRHVLTRLRAASDSVWMDRAIDAVLTPASDAKEER